MSDDYLDKKIQNADIANDYEFDLQEYLDKD